MTTIEVEQWYHQWVSDRGKRRVAPGEALTLLKDFAQQYANQQPVRGYSREDIEKAVNELAIESTAPDKETPDWMKSDIRRGIIRGIDMAQQPVNDGWVRVDSESGCGTCKHIANDGKYPCNVCGDGDYVMYEPLPEPPKQ